MVLEMSEPTRMLAVSEAGSMNEIEMALAEPTHAKVTATRINGSNTRTFICAPSTVRASLYRTRRVCKRAFPVPTVILNGGAQLQAFVVTVLTTICKPMQSGSSRTCSYGWGEDARLQGWRPGEAHQPPRQGLHKALP